MKTVMLQIEDTLGEIINEETITIDSSDKLIVQVPANATRESIATIFNHVKSMMENEELNVIVLPESVTLKVLKIN